MRVLLKTVMYYIMKFWILWLLSFLGGGGHMPSSVINHAIHTYLICKNSQKILLERETLLFNDATNVHLNTYFANTETVFR